MIFPRISFCLGIRLNCNAIEIQFWLHFMTHHTTDLPKRVEYSSDTHFHHFSSHCIVKKEDK